MTRSCTDVPPLIAIWSSPSLMSQSTMYPLLADSPGSMPSVLCAPAGVRAVPWLFAASAGVLIVTPQTTNPLASSFTWNFGESWSVIECIVKLDAPRVSTSAGLAEPPFVLPVSSHHDCVCPSIGSPPWPWIAPLPTMPEPAPRTPMNAEHVPPVVPHVGPYADADRDANRVTPASTQSVTPPG